MFHENWPGNSSGLYVEFLAQQGGKVLVIEDNNISNLLVDSRGQTNDQRF